jgi:hypothetical protein
MRITAALVASLLALCGCGRTRPETVALEPLARALQEEWPASTRDVRMTISVKQVTGHEVLHCRLENTSANAIELDSSALPWRTPALFQFRTVTAQGKVLPRYPPIVIQLVGLPQFVSIASGAILEGDVEPPAQQREEGGAGRGDNYRRGGSGSKTWPDWALAAARLPPGLAG